MAAVGIGIAIVVGTKIYESRVDRDTADTAAWLETEATIQGAAIQETPLQRGPSPPGFEFSYSVHGEYFSGRFFSRANLDQSDPLLKRLLNPKFPVQHDPDSPSSWYIAEATIAGYEIIQLRLVLHAAGLSSSGRIVAHSDIIPIFEFCPVGATHSIQRRDSKVSAGSCKELALIPSGQP